MIFKLSLDISYDRIYIKQLLWIFVVYAEIYGRMENNMKKENIFNNSSNRFMYLLLFPSLFAVLIFSYLPMAGIVIAFKNFDAIDGFDNFKKILNYPEFLTAIKNTLVYCSICLFGRFPFPIILALLFNEVGNVKFKKIVQTISYFPHFLSWASVCGLVYALFAINGPINSLLTLIFGDGYEKTNILMDSKNFLPVLFFSGLWKEIGWSTIIYLAAITGIDASLYEAAEVDGCNRFKQVLYITLPSIKTTIVLVLILGLGGLVSANFEQVYGLQNVYSQNETDVINTLIYRQGIQSGEYSLSTAFGLMQGVVSLVLVVGANKFSKTIAQTSLW